MRHIAKTIFEILEAKHNHHTRVEKTKSGYNVEGTHGTKYTFVKDGIEYAAVYETYSTGGDTYTVEKNGCLVDKREQLNILGLVRYMELT